MNKITIVGMGMMGASFALALKCAGIAQSVGGVDVQPAILKQALQRGMIDSAATELSSEVQDAEIVVLATPICTELELLQNLNELQYRGIIIDLGSTKQAICEMSQKLPDIRFVGCHPMAGSEIAGLDGAKAALFANAPVIITPTDDTEPALLNHVVRLWQALGSQVTVMDPAEHDFTVAVISHLPYLAAVVTMNTAAELAQHNLDMFSLIAGGFRDTTRISEGDPIMWRDICLTNQTHILTAICELKAWLGNLEQALVAQDANKLQVIFQTSQNRHRTYIPRKR